MAEQKTIPLSTLMLLAGSPMLLLGAAFVGIPETMKTVLPIDAPDPMMLGLVLLGAGLVDFSLAAFFKSRNL